MRSLPPWLVLVAVMAVSLAVNRAICLGCVDRHRGNRTCEWTGDTAFPIDVRNPAHWEHLVGDAQLAEELAIRYADTEFARRFGGSPGHALANCNPQIRSYIGGRISYRWLRSRCSGGTSI